jgi:SAM-dependent methyltransferase
MATQNQDRLRSLFAAAPDTEHSNRWDDLWKDSTFLPWDRGHANPALIDLLQERGRPLSSPDPNPSLGAPPPNSESAGYASLAGPLKDDGKRRRVLVPGCGRGYDVALFAAHGYDAYGLEVSSHAADAARKYLQEPGEGPLEGEYAVRDGKLGKGVMKVVCGDYFEDGWLGDVEGWEGDQGFDIIYDNTVSTVLRVECEVCLSLCTDAMDSSFAPSRPLSDQSGRLVPPRFSAVPRRIPLLLVVCSSVSSSQHTSPHPRAGRHGRFLLLYTASC